MLGRHLLAALLMLLLATEAAQPARAAENGTIWACTKFEHVAIAYSAQRENDLPRMPGDCMPVEPEREVTVLKNEGTLAWVNACAAEDGCFTGWLPTSLLQQRAQNSRREAPGTR